MASEELENSLRAQVSDYVDAQMSGARQEVTRLQSYFNDAFTRLLERFDTNPHGDANLSVIVGEHIRAAHARGVEEAAARSAPTKASSDMAILKAAIDEIDDQRSQADILGTLVNRAASYAPRVVFFLIKGEQAIGWRARGLEGSVGDDAARSITMPLATETLLSNVVQSLATASVEPGAFKDDHLLLERFGTEPPQRLVAVPLVVRGKAVAALYADSAALDDDAINLEALETLVRVAAMAVELLAVTRNAPTARPARFETQPKPKPQVVAPPAATAPNSPAGTTAATTAPLSSNAAPQANESAAPFAYNTTTTTTPPESFAPTVTPPPPAPTASPYIPPPLQDAAPFTNSTSAQPNGHALETAPPSTTPAEAPAAPASFNAPLGTARRYGSAAEADLPVDVSDEEKRLHNDARRFARLLVSEIKLYNDQKLRDGRANGDIYERLREDIDRSRQMYDKRVAPPVAARYDYFHQELVNTLAEGDAVKLGATYPGATV